MKLWTTWAGENAYHLSKQGRKFYCAIEAPDIPLKWLQCLPRKVMRCPDCVKNRNSEQLLRPRAFQLNHMEPPKTKKCSCCGSEVRIEDWKDHPRNCSFTPQNKEKETKAKFPQRKSRVSRYTPSVDQLRAEHEEAKRKEELKHRSNPNPTGAEHRSDDEWKRGWNRTHRRW